MSESVDLADLEMAFAKDPTSNAFIPLSTAYLEQGRFMEAMVVCKKGIRSQPENIDGRILLAKVYAGQGKIPKALDEIKKALDQDANVADAHFLHGQLHERSGRFDEAVDAFKQAVTLDRAHDAAKAALLEKGIDFDPGPTAEELEAQRLAEEAAARAAEEQQAAERAEAEAAAQAAAASARPSMAPRPAMGQRTSPSTPPSGAGSAPPTNVDMSQGYFASTYQSSAPGPAGRRLGLGFTFGLAAILLLVFSVAMFLVWRNAQTKEAINVVWKEAKAPFVKGTTRGLEYSVEKFGDVLKLDDEHPQSLARSAYALAELVVTRGQSDHLDKLKAILKDAKKFAGDEPETIAAEILYLGYEGKLDEAIAIASKEEADKKDGVDARVLAAKAAALVKKGELDEVRKIVTILEKSKTPTTLAYAGQLHRRLGHPNLARAALDGAIRLEPDHDPARAERALLILEEKDLDNLSVALDDVSHLVDLGKDNVGKVQRGYAILGRAEFKRIGNKKDEAARDFETARKELFKDPQVLQFYARWQDQQKDTAGALASMKKATELDPYRVAPWRQYVGYLTKSKKFKDARTALDKARAIFPQHPDLLTVEVELLGRQKKLKKAEELVRKKLADDDRPEYRRELGRIYLAKRDYENAVKTLKEAAEKGKKSPKLVKASIYTLLGRSLAKSDDHEGAIGALSEALSVSRSYAPAYYHLGKSLKATGKTGAAREAFQQAKKLDPASTLGAAAQRQIDAL